MFSLFDFFAGTMVASTGSATKTPRDYSYIQPKALYMSIKVLFFQSQSTLLTKIVVILSEFVPFANSDPCACNYTTSK